MVEQAAVNRLVGGSSPSSGATSLLSVLPQATVDAVPRRFPGSPATMLWMTSDQTTDTPPADPDYSSDGVDLTLIRWMLSLTPRERLEVLQASAGSLARLREVARKDS